MSSSKILKTLEIMATVGFGLGYFFYDLYVGTGVLMALLTLLVVTAKILGEKLTRLQLFSWLIVMVFGGATLLLQDQFYIKWKPTVINGTLGLILFGSHFVGARTIAERLLGPHLNAPATKLRSLNFIAGIYALFLAALNLTIAFQFSEVVWVNFKIFGLFALNMLFFVGSYLYLGPHVREYFERIQSEKS